MEVSESMAGVYKMLSGNCFFFGLQFSSNCNYMKLSEIVENVIRELVLLFFKSVSSSLHSKFNQELAWKNFLDY